MAFIKTQASRYLYFKSPRAALGTKGLEANDLRANSESPQASRTHGDIALLAAGFVSHNTFLLEFGFETSTQMRWWGAWMALCGAMLNWINAYSYTPL